MIRLLSTLCLVLLGGVVSATPEPGDLLSSMTKVSRDLSFRGHLLYAQEDFIRTLEILQGQFDDTQYQRMTSLDGDPAVMIRQGSQVYHVDSDSALTRLSHRSGMASLGFEDRFARTVPEHYRMALDGHGRVAGRGTWRVVLVPQDGHRYGYRLWIDEETHLLLRADTIDGAGRWLERFEYVNLDLEPVLSRSQFDVPKVTREETLAPVEEGSHPQGRVLLEPGWLPPGFTLVDQDLRRRAGDEHPVSALTWTDGLAGFTLFLEQAAGNDHEHLRHLGPTVAASRLLDNKRWHVTLVGEIPQETADKILASVELRIRND